MKKILIVDDSMYNRSLLSALLRKKGFAVETAEDGVEGVEKFRTSMPDAVFLDYIMPRMNGVQALEQMKTLSPDVRSFMLTSISSEEDVRRAKAAGADGYILKPYEPAKVFDLLNRFGLME